MSSPHLTHPRPGCVVEFLQGNQVQMGLVLEETSGRVRLFTLTRREAKMPVNRLLPWTGPVHAVDISREDMLHLLEEHAAKRAELLAAIDVDEIWELSQGEVEAAPLIWFAGLVYQDPGPDRIAALGRALLATKTRFKFQPPEFVVHDAEKVELLESRLAEEQDRERITEAGAELFKSLWSGRGEPAGLDLDHEVRARLTDLLKAQVAGKADEKDNKLWAMLRKGLPEHPQQALLLAQAWGVLPRHHNQLLDELGYDWGDGWSRQFAQAIADQRAKFEELRALPENKPEDLDLVSVDGPSTRDIDDAFHVAREGDGYRLTLALARPGLAWEFDSDLDLAVRARTTSLYLPEGTSHMLPEALGLDLYSLNKGQDRPALVAEFSVNAAGEPMGTEPRLGWVRVAENTHYQAVENALDDTAHPRHEQYALAHELAEKLIAARIRAGAMIINRPDPEITLEENGREVRVSMGLKPACPRAELMVSEFMILGTSGLAAWARDKGLPLLHRVQNTTLAPEATGIFEDPVEIFAVVKLLPPTMLDVEPGRHGALAVDAYAPVTSPIRRYVDLVNSAQIGGFLETGQPRFEHGRMESLLAEISPRAQAVGQVQRFRPRYWKLLFLKQQKARRQAILLEDQGLYPSLAMPELQLFIRAPRKLLGDKLYPGQLFELTFGRIDPLANEIKVIEAQEV